MVNQERGECMYIVHTIAVNQTYLPRHVALHFERVEAFTHTRYLVWIVRVFSWSLRFSRSCAWVKGICSERKTKPKIRRMRREEWGRYGVVDGRDDGDTTFQPMRINGCDSHTYISIVWRKWFWAQPKLLNNNNSFLLTNSLFTYNVHTFVVVVGERLLHHHRHNLFFFFARHDDDHSYAAQIQRGSTGISENGLKRTGSGYINLYIIYFVELVMMVYIHGK